MTDMDVLTHDPTNQHEGNIPGGNQPSGDRSPGVYVRQGLQSAVDEPHELDMLWSNRMLQKDDRRPVAVFLFGLLAGVLITAAGFMVFQNAPKLPFSALKLPTASNSAPAAVNTPTESDRAADVAPAQQADASNQDSSQDSASATPASTTSSSGAATSDVTGRTYEVQAGDNLGAIAIHEYGSNDPTLVEKIQRANNMANPDDLSIGQKLVIPPKAY